MTRKLSILNKEKIISGLFSPVFSEKF